MTHARMTVIAFEELDEDDGGMFTFYLVAPEEAQAAGREIESICTCDDLQHALAIATAWNAYFIKN